MSGSSEICPKCQKPTASKGGGSITQWIAVCRCNSAPEEPETQSAESRQICLHCGKHVSAGRSGSFTQYVFRHDLCSCEKPMPGAEARDEKRFTHKGAKFDQDLDPDEVELPLEAEKFPSDRYKPLTLLGRGAAGAVYLCRDRLLGKKVAVKTLNELTSEQLVSFQMEAKATSKLKHKLIVAVMDFGATEAGCPFMVMEYIDGISLAEYLNERGVLEVETALTICRNICQALAYVHDHDIYHRDLKPTNIILVNPESKNMEVHLIDFGVAQAKFNTLEPTIFQGKTVVGTPNYMSPDQVMGLSYDARSEIYSLGCLLFELLTGRPPFLSNSALETLSMHAHNAPPRLADLTDIEFPAHVEELVARCLEKDPDDRFQNMKELEAAFLRDPSSSDDTPSSSDDAPYVVASGGKPKNDRIVLFGIVAAVAIATVGVLGMSLLQQREPPRKTVKVKQFDPSLSSMDLFSKSLERDTIAAKKQVVKDNCVYLEGTVDAAQLSEIARLHPNLEGIDTSRAESVEWTGFEHFTKSKVSRVSAPDSNVRDEDILHFAQIPTLKVLQLPGTNIEGLGMKYLAFTGVDHLSLSSTRIAGRQTFDDLTHLKQLRRLNINSTLGWSGKDLEPLRGAPLRILSISMTDCGDEGAAVIATMKDLRVLFIENCRVTSKGVAAFSRLRNLTTLNLAKNPSIKKSAILPLASLKNLRDLYVDSNCMDQTGIAIMRRQNPNLIVHQENVGNLGD